MAGRKLHRWVFSWLCQWFPSRVRGRRRPIFRDTKPILEKLEDRWSPTSINVMQGELAASRHSPLDSARIATAADTGTSSEWIEEAPNREISLSLSTPRSADDNYVPVRATAQAQEPAASSVSVQQGNTTTNMLVAHLSSRPFTPLSTQPKPIPSALTNANPNGGGGAVRSGASTPNAGMGGGGPTGGGGGPGMVNANNFIGVNLGGAAGTSSARQVSPPVDAQRTPGGSAGSAASSPLTDFQTTYSMSDPPPPASSPMAMPSVTGVSGSMPFSVSPSYLAGPLYVLDMNTGETIPPNTPLNSFSTWSEDLLAQVVGTSVTGYYWNTSQAPDLTGISGQNSQNLQGTWASFTGSAHTDIITLTAYTSGAPSVMTITYLVAGSNSPAFSASRPTSSGTWSNVLTPDQLSADQATQALGPFANLGLADGSVQTSFAMPSYNPNVSPVALDYDSDAAAADPVFMVHYQVPSGLSSVTAQLTLNGVAGPSIQYGIGSTYNPGDWLQIDLQANTTGVSTGLSTGRYPYTITLYNGSTTTTYSGKVDIVNQGSSHYGAGWSLDGVEQLLPVTGGVMIVDPGGTSLFFAGSGTYTSPPGDFSTLVKNGSGYTRTMPDGTQINFNSSGQQTSVVDTDGNTTAYNYSSGLLTSITDMNGQTTTLTYSGGELTKITDPASRVATLSYNSYGELTSITDPGTNLWKYSYNDVSNGAHRMASLGAPNSLTTMFDYNAAGLVDGMSFANTTISCSIIPMEFNGLAIGTSTHGTAALLATGDQAQFFNSDGDWITEMDWLGFGGDVQDIDPLGDAALTYLDTNGLPWMSADALGRPTRLFFNSQGNPTEIVYADDTTAQYQYNTFSEVTKYTDPTGDITTYAYNSKGDLTSITDALNKTTTYAYNTAGLVTSTTDPLTNTTTFAYNSLNELTSTTDALHHTTTFAYDNAGDVTSSTDPLGFVTSYSYNALGWMTGETLPNTTNTYATYTYSYNSVGDLTGETTPLGGQYVWGYNSLEELVGITDPLQGTISMAYDNAGNLIGVTDPDAGSWAYVYNAAGEATKVTDPLSGVTTYAFDAAGEQTSVTNPLNQAASYSYTQTGALSSVTDALGDVTSYGYNAAGDQTSVSQGGPSSSTYTMTYGYNALHEMTSSTDQLGKSTTYGYDANGNQTSVTDSLGHAVTYGYNALSEMTLMTDALSNQTTYGYDADGNQTLVTDPLSHTTTSTYNAQGQVLSMTNALNGVTSYEYDSMGNETSITDPDNNTTTFAYNSAGQLTSETNPMGYATTYSYNNFNELTSTTDADGRRITYSYNHSGQETGETWWQNMSQTLYTATYSYNTAGQLTAASDPYSSYTFTYNAAGEEASVSNRGTPGVPTVTLSFGYDVYGNRTSLSDSLDGSISYAYNADNEMTSLGLSLSSTLDAQLTFAYNTAGLLTGMTRTAPSVSGDTITSTYGYDKNNNLTNITDVDTTKSVTLANYTYGYDNASELTSYQDNSGNSLTYGYDKVGELTSATGTLLSKSYTFTYNYDSNGNRASTSTDVNGSLTSATYAAPGPGNELLNDGTYSYTYDHEGNMLTQTNIATGTVTYYTWDYENRLTEEKVETSSGTVLEDEKFTYDVFGNRIGVSLNGTQQLYTVYDGSNPYMDFSGSGTLTERYLTNPNNLNQFFGQVSASGTTEWFLTDNINSIRQVISASGSVLDAITYDPYGNILNQTNSANAPRFLYTGAAYDPITGTYLDKAREDNPLDGRWLSQDPSGLRPDSNPYRYVGNDAINKEDPMGLEPLQTKYYYKDPWVEEKQGESKDMIVATVTAQIKNIDKLAGTYQLSIQISSEVPEQKKLANPKIKGGMLPAGVNLRTETFLRFLEPGNRAGVENTGTLTINFPDPAPLEAPKIDVNKRAWPLPNANALREPKNIVWSKLPDGRATTPSVVTIDATFPMSSPEGGGRGEGSIVMNGIDTDAQGRRIPAPLAMRPIYLSWFFDSNGITGDIAIEQRGMPRVEK